MSGAQAAARLLTEARTALADLHSPAVRVVDALYRAQQLNHDGLRRVLRPANRAPGGAP